MRLLDLFCGAGGAAVGYHRAGFDDIVGVDIVPQPRYPFTFVQADAMTYPLDGFDAIHASPPCQAYSIMRNLPWLADREYPELLAPTWRRFADHGTPWVIENVENAPMPHSTVLCAWTLGMPMYRHRRFGSSILIMAPPHRRHVHVIAAGRSNLNGRYPDRSTVGAFGFTDGVERSFGTLVATPHPDADGHNRHLGTPRIMSGPVGHSTPSHWLPHVREAMGIDWMRRDELTQAIPPAYTELIGAQLVDHIRAEAA